MRSSSVKKLYAIHGWVGVITGILLFVIAFTGALSVFGRPEIKIWANPEIRQGIDLSHQQIAKVIEQHAKTLPEAYHEEILIFMPGARSFANLKVLFEDHENEQAVLLTFNNQTLEVIQRRSGTPREVFAEREIDIADFVVDFHADLHLGRPIGLLTTGLLGLTLMASVITGFVIHRQKLKQLFTFRRRKSIDITLADAHKVMGVWGMLFNGVIAFTGAFLGLASVLLIPAAAFVSFNGDQEKLVETFTTTPEPELAHVYQPTRLTKILAHAEQFDLDMRTEVVTIYGYNDENSLIYVSAVGSDTVARQILSYSGASGEFNEAFGQFGKVGGVSAAILDLMFPLHFGNFGGAFVKLIWTLLGLSTALLPLSGMMLWLQRRRSEPNGEKSYQRFNRLVIGSCGGIVLACAALFPTQLVMQSMALTSGTFNAISAVFFSSWLACILLALLLPNANKAASMIGYATGGILLATVPMNTFVTHHNLVGLLLNQHWVAGLTDLSLLVIGAATLYCTWRLSKQEPKPEQKPEQGALV